MSQGEIMIRLATPDDSAAIVELLRLAFEPLRPHYTDRAIELTISDPEGIAKRIAEGPIWLAELNKTLVGSVSVVVKNDRMYIRGMGVDPTYHGRGIGSALLNEVDLYAEVHRVEHLFLHTAPFLTSAIRLYERFGFRKVGDVIDWEGTPVFAMERTIAGP